MQIITSHAIGFAGPMRSLNVKNYIDNNQNKRAYSLVTETRSYGIASNANFSVLADDRNNLFSWMLKQTTSIRVHRNDICSFVPNEILGLLGEFGALYSARTNLLHRKLDFHNFKTVSSFFTTYPTLDAMF